MLAGVLSLVAGLLLLPVIISTVGSASYGVWILLTVVANYLFYADLGVGAAIIHFGSRTRAGDSERTLGQFLSAALAWNTGICVLVVPLYVAGATLYISSIGSSSALTSAEGSALVLIGALTLTSVVLRPFASTLVGAGLLPVERRNQSIAVLVRIAGTLIACFGFESIVAIAAAEAFALVLPTVLSGVHILRHRLVRLSVRGNVATLRFMFAYSLKSFGVGAIGALILQGGTLIIGITGTPSMVTYFNAAFRIYGSVRQILTWTLDPFRSSLSRLYASDVEAAKRTLYSLSFLALAASAIGCLTIVFATPWIVETWLGAGVPVSDVSMTIVILLLGLIANAIHVPFAPAGDALGRPGAFIRAQVIWLLLFLAAGFLLSPVLGIAGVALGLTLPLLVVEPLYMRRATRVLSITTSTWRSRVGFPALLLVGPGAAVALVFALALFSSGQPAFTIWTSLVFFAGVCLTFLISRRRLPVAQIQALFRTEL
jgi:O-antigen/teichoic acid export membrane protein